MGSSNKYRKVQRSAAARIAATSMVLEVMESRVLMSTTVAAWNFDSLTVTTTPNLSPAPSTGTGTALTVGLQTSSSNTNSPGGVYAYPNAGASGTGDISDILNGTGNNPSGNQADHSSTGDTTGTNPTGTNPAWRLRGSSDGWSSNAAVASQGAQFSTSTAGVSGISLSFDVDPSSGSAPSEIAVQYTTDGSTWTTLPASDLGTPTSATGATTDVTVATGTGGSLVNGGYFQFANSTTTPDALYWQNGFTANLSGITAVNGNANFGVRIVNAASGAAEFEVGGTAYPTAGAGNWRLDNVVISATGGAQTAPSVTNPTNQTVAAGQPVTFTSTGTGNPTPTVQWYEGGTPAVGLQAGADTGGGTLLSGATSSSLTFTTNINASDNGNTYWAEYHNVLGYVDTTAATLTDTLAAPVVTTQPTSVSTTIGSTVTFTAAASGSPVPTVQWQSSPNGTTWTNISGATSTTYSFTAASGQNNEEFRAVFTNSQAPSGVNSNAATLTLGGTVLAAWNFSNSGALVAGQTILNPGPSIGSGTANSLGMAPNGTYSVYPGTPAASFTLTVTDSSGSYTTASIPTGTSAASIQSTLRALHPATTSGIVVTTSPTASAAAGVLLTGDAGATLTGSGTGTGFFVALDNSSLTSSQVTGSPDDSNLITSADGTGSPNIDSANINAWRIVGANGWNSGAPIGDQGAQFLSSTTGYSSIQASFDLYATAQGEGKLQVEYTTDGTNWNNVPAADLSIGAGDTNISIQNNTNVTDTNTVQGGYFDITGGGSSNLWYNDLGVNLIGISGVNNNANFGIRIVNASTSADCVNISGASLNNSSGNNRIGDVQITGNNPVAPIITTNPVNQSVASGVTATFTAAAVAYPAATVQWYEEAPGATSFTPDTTDAGNTTTTLQVVASGANSGTQYEAVFTNTVGSTPTTPATLSVGPVITTQPVSQTVAVGTANVTFTAVATGNPTPTVQWEMEAPGGSFAPVSGANFSGTTSTTLTISAATENLTGYEFEAIFTNSGGAVTTVPATLTVTGTPIAQWIFTGGEAPPANGSTQQGTGNSPFPTFGPDSNIASTNGLVNNYTGINAVSESDVLIERSTLNPNFSEYDWRIRSGNGSGPTGSPGTPEGWSQNAPEWDQTSPYNAEANDFEQGVQFDVDTTGYSNITLHFDWNQGGISDMQPVYSLDGGNTWTALPNSLIEQTVPSGDFYGITATTAPTGITVNLQGIAGADNNPNFELQLDAAYNPTLPLISDGNLLDPTVHGQYATGIAGNVNAQQVLQFNSGINDGDTVPLTYNGNTVNFTYSSTVSTLIANLTAALTTLVGANNFSILPTNYTSQTESSATLLQPKRDGLGNSNTDMTVTFNGALAATNVATMTTTNSNVVIATWVTGSTNGFKPYVDGGGAWQIGNISFNGDSVQAGGLAITANPASTTGTTGFPVTFTSTAYSEDSGVTAQWYDNGVLIGGATNISNSGFNYSSTYTFDPTSGQNGDLFTCVFTQGSAHATSQAGTLTVVQPVAPVVVVPPFNAAVQAGQPVVFSATATGSPAPTVQWQISSDNGAIWTNLTNSATVTGATSTTLDYTTNSNGSENGDLFRAVFTNAVAPVNSPAAVLTVFSSETILTDWDFNNTYSNVTSSGSSPDPYINSPAPVAAGVNNSADVGGVASAIGFTLPYNGNDSATGDNPPGTGSVNADDIVNSPGSANPNFNENTWRIRGGVTATSGGTPANGWSNFALPYTQGAQFSVPTTGYDDIYVTMDWYSTTSGELDAQPQYTLDGTNWINLGNQVQAVSNDFFGATSTGGTIPLMFNLSNIAGAANNPNFGIRLVNAYDPTLSNTQDLELADTNNFTLSFQPTDESQVETTGTIVYSSNPTQMAANVQAALAALLGVGTNNVTVTAPSGQSSNLQITWTGLLNLAAQSPITSSDANDAVFTDYQYANAALTGSPPSPAPYNGSKGNWRFDNIVFHGMPTWLAPSSQATWNPTNSTLTVTGPSTIISDPGADEPIIAATGAAAQLLIDPTIGNQDIHIGGFVLSDGASIDVMPLGTGHYALVVGTAAGGTPTLSIDATSDLNLQSNDMIVHNGNLTGVNSLVVAGANDGRWNGDGIFSSAAANSSNTELGVEMNTTGETTIDGETVSSSDVLVFYTFDGAVDFSTRAVDAADYLILDNAFNNHLTTFPDGNFADGDFNYDGVINGDDYTLIDNAYNSQSSIPLAVAAPAEVATNVPQVAKNTAQIAVLPAKSSGSTQALFAQTATIAFDDSDLKKRHTSVWANLGN